MIKTSSDINIVKRDVKSVYGEDVLVKVSLGRNKYATYEGKLTNIYPWLFTIEPYGEFNGKTSFSYAELMCGNVKIKPKNFKNNKI